MLCAEAEISYITFSERYGTAMEYVNICHCYESSCISYCKKKASLTISFVMYEKNNGSIEKNNGSFVLFSHLPPAVSCSFLVP